MSTGMKDVWISPRRVRRVGLTLVELLVVTGIIALLVATLVPIVSKARETARRAVCLSNQREVHRAFVLYAHTNDDRVPIGYRQTKQFNAIVYSAAAGQFVLMGKLYPAGMIDSEGVFFCPSEEDEAFTLNSPDNPWPAPAGAAAARRADPVAVAEDGAGGGTVTAGERVVARQSVNTYAGFATRPDHQLPDDFARPPASLSSFVMPRLNGFRNEAILADLMQSPDRLQSRHGGGVNVAYGHGGARWVSRDHFGQPLAASAPISWPPDPRYDDEQDAIWRAFDRAQ